MDDTDSHLLLCKIRIFLTEQSLKAQRRVQFPITASVSRYWDMTSAALSIASSAIGMFLRRYQAKMPSREGNICQFGNGAKHRKLTIVLYTFSDNRFMAVAGQSVKNHSLNRHMQDQTSGTRTPRQQRYG